MSGTLNLQAASTAFACGVILLYWFGILPPLPGIAVILMAAAALMMRAGHSAVRRCLQLFCVALIGLAWAAWNAESRLEQALPTALEARELSVTGHLCSVPEPGSYGSVRFSFCVSDWPDIAGSTASTLPERLRLAWYGDDAHLDLPATASLTVMLKRPHGNVNPAGFRYEDWLFQRGFRATGTVRNVVAEPDLDCDYQCRYHRWRQRLSLALHQRLGDMRHFALAESLLLGNRGRLSNHHWAVLRGTGTIHLVAISGLHLGLIAIGTGFLLSRLLRALPANWLAPARRRMLLFAGVALASGLYALVAGFTVPTRRALVMVVVGAWLIFRARSSSPWQAFTLAIALVLLLQPSSALGQGFWLSFGAVAVLILVFSGRLGATGPVRGLVMAQLAVFAGLWPVLTLLDSAPASAGLLANLLAIPWVSLVVMPLLMLAVPVLVLVPAASGLVVVVLDTALGVLWMGLEALHGLSLPAVGVSLMPALLAACSVLACLWLPGRLHKVAVLALGGLLLLPLMAFQRPAQNDFVAVPEAWIWDVGQGLAVLFRHGDQTLLYDTGPESASGFNAVESVLLPSLQAIGVRRIDTLVISHGDSDHAGGLKPLFAGLPVTRVIAGEPVRLEEALGGAGRSAEECESGTGWGLGQARIHLWHGGADSEKGVATGNDASCAVIITLPQADLILPGDISSAMELRWLEDGLPDRSGERVVVAAHHGSKTSSSAQWVKATAADHVIYTAGYRHHYGHPHEDVKARYDRIGAQAYNTAHTGALRLRMPSDGDLEVTFGREGEPFWIRPPPE